jgi:hypothetical protein
MNETGSGCERHGEAQELCARREMVAALLGGLGTAALLSGCSASQDFKEDAEPTEQLQLALSGSAVLKFADTVVELRALSGGANTWIAVLSGYHAKGDGGGGVFYWSSSVAPDNGGTTFNSGSGIGAGWRRILGGAIDAKWFGARGDTLANDAPAIQSAINYLKARGGSLVFSPSVKPDGTAGYYRCDTTLDLDDTHGLALIGNAGPAASAPTARHPTLVYTGTGTLIRARSASHLRLSGLHFRASHPSHPGDLVAFGRLGPLPDAGDILIEACGFEGSSSTASLINLNETICVTIRQNAFLRAIVGIRGRAGSYSNAVTIDGANTFHFCSTAAIYNAGENWLISGAIFEGFAEDGVSFSPAYDQDTSAARALTFQNCWCGDAPDSPNVPRVWFKVTALGLLFSNNYVANAGNASTALVVRAGSQGVVLTGGRIETDVGVEVVGGVVRGFSAIGVDGLTIANKDDISAGIAFGNYGTGNELWLTSAEGLVIRDLPSSNPGPSSRQLWYDPADGNRVKFAP